MKRLALVLLMGCALGAAQEIQFGDARPASAKKQYVALEDSALNVEAGKEQTVEVRFAVSRGLHVNSAAPKDETLIPTTLKLESTPAVRVLHWDMPAGKPFHLSVGAGEDIDTYQGEFRVRVRLKAAKGTSELKGELRYQACDNASCYPPRVLPVVLVVNGR